MLSRKIKADNYLKSCTNDTPLLIYFHLFKFKDGKKNSISLANSARFTCRRFIWVFFRRLFGLHQLDGKSFFKCS